MALVNVGVEVREYRLCSAIASLREAVGAARTDDQANFLAGNSDY